MRWRVARKGALKPVYKLNIGIDQELLQAVKTSADLNERGFNQEVRYRLRQAYQMESKPAEDQAVVSA